MRRWVLALAGLVLAGGAMAQGTADKPAQRQQAKPARPSRPLYDQPQPPQRPAPGTVGFAAILERHDYGSCRVSMALFNGTSTLLKQVSVTVEVLLGRQFGEIRYLSYALVDPGGFRVARLWTSYSCSSPPRLRIRETSLCTDAPDCDGTLTPIWPAFRNPVTRVPVQIQLDGRG